jgi:hypothetical protein
LNYPVNSIKNQHYSTLCPGKATVGFQFYFFFMKPAVPEQSFLLDDRLLRSYNHKPGTAHCLAKVTGEEFPGEYNEGFYL